MQGFFLQQQRNLGPQAFQIHTDRWARFTAETRRKQMVKQQQAIAQTMDQEVFLLFKIELRKAPQARNVTRTF